MSFYNPQFRKRYPQRLPWGMRKCMFYARQVNFYSFPFLVHYNNPRCRDNGNKEEVLELSHSDYSLGLYWRSAVLFV